MAVSRVGGGEGKTLSTTINYHSTQREVEKRKPTERERTGEFERGKRI